MKSLVQVTELGSNPELNQSLCLGGVGWNPGCVGEAARKVLSREMG